MSPVNIGVLISGGGTNLQALIDNIDNDNINGRIKIVVSNKRDAYGLERAKASGIPTMHINRKDFSNEEEYNKKIIQELKAKGVELVVLAGYLKVLSSEFIRQYNMKIINIHPSLIPSFSGKGYYGENVHKAVLDRGVKLTGATTHFVDEGTDTGPIIMQKCINIDEDENIKSLKEKVLEIEHNILVKSVAFYCNGMLKTKDGKVNIRKV